jgi:hypothetical protein
MDSWLIQRANINIYSYENGVHIKQSFSDINKLLDFDYMGSSEFEWGALPRSYKRIRFNLKNYKIFDTGIKNFNGVSCFVLCNELLKDATIKNINVLAEGNLRLKEYITFQYHIKKSEYSWDDPSENFWWDIENDFMFWFGGEDINNAILEVIENDTVEFLATLKDYKVKYWNGTEEVAKGEEINNKIRIYNEDGTTKEININMTELII